MSELIQQLYDSGMSSEQVQMNIQSLRQKYNEKGMIDSEFNDRLGIHDFDSSPIQEYLVRSAKNVFGESGEKFTREVFTLDDFVRAGFNYSTGSLAFDAPSENAKNAVGMKKSIAQSTAEMLGQTVGDIPAGVAGAVIGGATALFGGQAGPQAGLPEEIVTMPLAAMGGAFAIPEAIRAGLLRAYEHGDVDTFDKMWDVVTDSSIAGMKGFITGISAGAAGKLVAPIVSKAQIPIVGPKTARALKYAAVTEAEIAAFSAVGPALEGRMPTIEDFVAANIAIFGVKAGVSATVGTVRAGRRKIENVFVKTGVTPDELQRIVERDVTVQEDLASSTHEIPRAMQNPEQRAQATDLTWVAGSEKTIEWKKQSREEVYNDPDTIFGELSFDSIANSVKLDDIELGAIYERIRLEHHQGNVDAPTEAFIHKHSQVKQSKLKSDRVPFFVLKEPLVVFRGTNEDGLNSTVSTTLSSSLAAAEATLNNGTLFRITLPVGTVIAMPSKVYGPNSLKNNLEIIIHPDEIVKPIRESTPREGVLGNKSGDATVQKPDAFQAVERKVGTEILPGQKSLNQHLDALYFRVVDDLHPLNQVTKDLAGGKDLLASQNPYTLARLFRGVYQLADSFLEFGTLKYHTKERIGTPLREILRPIDQAGSIGEFQTYAIAKRALELLKQVETGVRDKEFKLPAGFTKENLINVVNAGKKQFEAPFRELRKYQTQVLEYVRDSGVISQEAFRVIEEANKDYVPYNRIFSDQDSGPIGGMLQYAQNAIRPMSKKGSGRDIVNPIESIVRNTYMLVTLAERNRVMTALVDLQKKSPDLTIIAPKKASAKSIRLGDKEVSKMLEPYLSEDVLNNLNASISDVDFTVWRRNVFVQGSDLVHMKDGKPKVYEILDQNIDLVEAMSQIDRKALNPIIKILSKPTSWLRAGAILNPDFIAKNTTRDTIMATLFSKDGFIPVYDTFRGAGHILGRTDLAKDWAASGGMFSHMQSIDQTYMQKGMKQMLQSIPVRNLVQHPMELLRAISSLAEQGTRLATYDRRYRRARTGKRIFSRNVPAKSRIDAMSEAAFESRDITIDFQRFGRYGRSLNAMSAFLNAFVQGQDKLVREIKNRPLSFTAKAVGGIVVPSALLHLYNRNEEWYKALPAWERDLHWHMKLGDTIYRAPKPFEIGILLGTGTERMIEWALTQDPEQAISFAKSLGTSLVPNLVPTIIQVPLEMNSNRSFFFNRPIIPRDREGMLPEYQHNTYTTEFAKEISQSLVRIPGLNNPNSPVGPAMLEHALRGLTGGLGNLTLQLTNEGLKKIGVLPDEIVRPETSLSDIPLVRAFVTRYPKYGTSHIEQFYKMYNRHKAYSKSIKKLEDEATTPKDFAEIVKLQKKQLDEGILFDATDYALQIRDASSVIRQWNALKTLPNMTKEELSSLKREVIDNQYFLISTFAQQGVKMMKMGRRVGTD